MPKCTILVGVPASGKSTWLEDKDWRAKIISTDDIIEELARVYGFTYDQAFSNLVKFAEQVMWSYIKTAAENGDPIYIDRTNMTARARKKFIDFLKPFGYEFECVVFPTPEPEEWMRRLDSRPGKTIPQEVLDRMVDSYEMPLMSEGFTKITYVH